MTSGFFGSKPSLLSKPLHAIKEEEEKANQSFSIEKSASDPPEQKVSKFTQPLKVNPKAPAALSHSQLVG